VFQDIPGVVAFLSAKDIPGKNSFAVVGLMTLFEDEEVS
jgi:xanthine dehydrogenase molybdopterin-binding subunit B